MLKRKAFWLLLLAAGGIMRLGVECFPEPDVALNLLDLSALTTTGTTGG
ncbi:MAG: hypothetical protein KAY37_07580 [Phycisphaerae bacterium]|nr:hypothetical protein [Phycisphaerae bacterium]